MTRSSAWPYNSPAWRQARKLVLERDGGLCQIRSRNCRVAANQVDHIVPWRIGGALFDPENLRAACVTCNSARVEREVKRRPSREW